MRFQQAPLPWAGTFWWIVIDQVPLRQAFGSPFPYLLLAISWFIAAPIYWALAEWVRLRLGLLLLLATLAAAPFAIFAIRYFLTPRDVFAAALILSTAWVAAIAFWAVLRMLSR